MREFLFLECPTCGWSCVRDRAETRPDLACLSCEDDGVEAPLLRGREATDDDAPTGYDDRKGKPS